MMSRPGTFERIYAALRDRLRTGHYRPGNRLEPAILSDELNASVTPIRDALHRLTGERLVEAPPHEGFRVPVMTETTLRHLFAWHRDLLLLAVANRRVAGAGDPGTAVIRPATADDRLTSLFVDLAGATGNPEHVLAVLAIIERIEPLRRLEAKLLDAIDSEADEILDAFSCADRHRLRAALLRYHRRRLRIIPRLLDQIQRD